MEILRFKELGDTESVITNAVWVFILSLIILCMMLMEIFHFNDLGDTTSVVTNAVVLVLGEC